MRSIAKVFRDREGNRTIFPAYVYDDDEHVPCDLWAVGMTIMAATGLRMEAEWFEFDRSQFPHIKTDIGSPGFAHGSENVFLFDGPVFEAAKQQHKGPIDD